MAILSAAVVLVGVLCALDLILTVGVVKRLREHSDFLAALGSGGTRPSLETGDEIGEFETVTLDGTALHRDTLDRDTVVAFFAPDCKPCEEKLPRFLEFAQAFPAGRDGLLVALVGDAATCAALSAKLNPVARVVVEEQGGPLCSAFGVSGTPTVLLAGPGAGPARRPVLKVPQLDLAVTLGAPV